MTQEKARTHRLQRLRVAIEQRLENPAAALESLLSELKAGQGRPELWEGLHAASLRDQKETDLAAAYRKILTPQRMREQSPAGQAEILMHAADFMQGVQGDAAGAEELLHKVLGMVPGHPEAFSRLERKYTNATDKKQLIELYATVADVPPKPADELARTALNAMMFLPAGSTLSDKACEKLILYTPVCAAILKGLDTHCKKTGRTALAGDLIERAVDSFPLVKAEQIELRRRLLDLFEEAGVRGRAMPHVEWLLEEEPNDKWARAMVERLLTHREVGARATAAVRQAKKRAQSFEA